MIKDIFHAQEERMKKTLEALRRDFGSLRAGRATPALLDRVMVDYYGQPTPVSQVAAIAVPEPRMLMITPWEKTILHDIEKAIMKSDLGLTPNSDGTAVRLSIPQLTQERRTELVKSLNKKTEDAKVAIRRTPPMMMTASRIPNTTALIRTSVPQTLCMAAATPLA